MPGVDLQNLRIVHLRAEGARAHESEHVHNVANAQVGWGVIQYLQAGPGILHLRRPGRAGQCHDAANADAAA